MDARNASWERRQHDRATQHGGQEKVRTTSPADTFQDRGQGKGWTTSPADTFQTSPQRGNTSSSVEVQVASTPPTAPVMLAQQVPVFSFQPAEIVDFIRQLVQATPPFPPEDVVNFIRLMMQNIPIASVPGVSPPATPSISPESVQRMLQIATTVGTEGQNQMENTIRPNPMTAEADSRRRKRVASQFDVAESSAKFKRIRPRRPDCENCGKPHLGVCLLGQTFCFECKEEGHEKRQCPTWKARLQSGSRKRGGQKSATSQERQQKEGDENPSLDKTTPQQSTTSVTIKRDVLKHKEAQAGTRDNTGILFIQNDPAYALIHS